MSINADSHEKVIDLLKNIEALVDFLQQKKVSHLSTREKENVPDNNTDLPLVGKSAPMQGVYRLIARLMNTDLPVLVLVKA